jgi:membrane protein implicated in regulation of membrane protease activity
MAWVWWSVAAVLFLAAELATATLACAMAALGAVVAAVLGLLGVGIYGQLPAFALVSVGLIAFLRPAVMRHQELPGLRTGVAALVGRDALVLIRVDAHAGQIKLGGQTWTARTADPEAVFEPGSTVHVCEIDGATAVVL